MDWIKLTEKKPKDKELVFSLIVYRDNGKSQVNVGNYYYNEKHKQHRIVYYDLTYHYAGDELGEVYWMPVPDPPKEAIT